MLWQRQPTIKLHHIPTIALDGVLRQTVGQPQAVGELVDEGVVRLVGHSSV